MHKVVGNYCETAKYFVPLQCQDKTNASAARRQLRETSKTAPSSSSDIASAGHQLRQTG
jgi:hypothetical protein